MSSERITRVGFVGLGKMGAPVAANLIANGMTVTAFDLDPMRVKQLTTQGARAAADLSDVSANEVVFVCVPGPAEVQAVVLDRGTLADLMSEGSVLVCLSTVSSDLIRELDHELAGRGISLVEAPISGTADDADAGTLTVIAGARDSELERCRFALGAVSRAIVHVGPPGTAAQAKLLTQSLSVVAQVALADILAVAARRGLNVEAFAGLVPQTPASSWVSEHILPSLIEGRTEPSYTLGLQAKDCRLLLSVIGEHDGAAPLSRMAAERILEACERLGPDAEGLAWARLA